MGDYEILTGDEMVLQNLMLPKPRGRCNNPKFKSYRLLDDPTKLSASAAPCDLWRCGYCAAEKRVRFGSHFGRILSVEPILYATTTTDQVWKSRDLKRTQRKNMQWVKIQNLVIGTKTFGSDGERALIPEAAIQTLGVALKSTKRIDESPRFTPISCCDEWKSHESKETEWEAIGSAPRFADLNQLLFEYGVPGTHKKFRDDTDWFFPINLPSDWTPDQIESFILKLTGCPRQSLINQRPKRLARTTSVMSSFLYI